MSKSPWQQEFDALPEWAKMLVKGLAGFRGYSVGDSGFTVNLAKGKEQEWSDGFNGAVDLAHALTAPWPPAPEPVREQSMMNIVEMVSGPEDSSFDQPCAFGYRVESHAVYCHNEAWPDCPRKCRRSAHDPDYKHEDCPGFTPNSAYQKPIWPSPTSD